MGLYKAVSNASKTSLVGLAGFSVGVVNDEIGELLPHITPDSLTPLSNSDRLKRLAMIVILSIVAAALFPVIMGLLK